MERWVAKLLAAIIIFITNALAGILPIKASDWFESKGDRGKLYLSIANCFGGGVFLGAFLMHMAPEVRELMEEVYLIPNGIDYPIPELMTFVGFFLVLSLDTGITILVSKKSKVSTVEMTACSTVEGHQNGEIVKATSNGETNLALSDDGIEASKTNQTETLGMTEMDSVDEFVARPLIVLVGLSFHFLFEGMSLGLQDSSSGVWTLVLAILSHELVISFSFGLRLVKVYSVKKVIGIMVAYSSAIPVGVAIGAIIYETSGGSEEVDITTAFILGLSAGIFIYVAFLEILSKELSSDPRISKIIAIAIGFIFMACMVFVEEIGGEDSTDTGTEAPPVTVP